MKIRVTVFLSLVLCLGQHSAAAQTAPASDGRTFDNLYLLQNRETARVSSYDKSGGNMDWVVVPPGKTVTLAEIPGAGVIRRFYLSPFALDRMRYRKLILRMYWDGRTEPCVEVPIGDLFGVGIGALRYFHSSVVDVNFGFRSWDFDGMVSYFPMPFAKGARITLENDGDVGNFRIWYQFDYEQYPAGGLPSNAGRFHAQWNRVAKTPVKPEEKHKNNTLANAKDPNTEPQNNYVILDTTGQGSYVGHFLTIDNIAGGWYGEGDDMIFVDDGWKWPPRYAGTGTEETINGGCCPNAEYSGLNTGYYLIENRNGPFGGKNQMYRFMINDPIRFQKSIRVTLEHGHNNNFENDYTTTAFWYQKDPHKSFPRMPEAKERLPQWPEGVAEALEKEATLRQEISDGDGNGDVKPDAKDRAELFALEDARNKEFREFRYQDFLRDVAKLEEIVNKYKTKSSQ